VCVPLYVRFAARPSVPTSTGAGGSATFISTIHARGFAAPITMPFLFRHSGLDFVRDVQYNKVYYAQCVEIASGGGLIRHFRKTSPNERVVRKVWGQARYGCF